MLIKHLKTVMCTFLIFSSMGVMTHAYANKESLPPPSQELEAISSTILANMRDNRALYKKDSSAFIKEVSQKLSPVVAFNSIARGVMGRYTRTTTPAQIAQFTDVFKNSLINFYGNALLTLGDGDISILNITKVPDSIIQEYKNGHIRQVPVNMTVKSGNRSVVISYAMIFEEGHWKLRNIIIDGINIGVQFRRQFNDAMDRFENIEKVIDNWPQIMSPGNSSSNGKNNT